MTAYKQVPLEPTIEMLSAATLAAEDRGYCGFSFASARWLYAQMLAAAPEPPAESAFPLPQSLHWLGDREDANKTRHAMDTRGCVMYFERQSDCLQFMRWLTERAAPPALSKGG